MGKVDFDGDVWLGIDLKKKNCNGNNGEAGGRKYFEPKETCGYFIKMNEIERILPSKSQKQKKKKKKKKKRKCLKNFPKLGDRVRTVDNKTGIVEFIGVICLVKDICIGLTLDEKWEHGNDGSVKGKRYFSCEKGRGYFVRLQHLVENLGSTLGVGGIKDMKQASNIDPKTELEIDSEVAADHDTDTKCASDQQIDDDDDDKKESQSQSQSSPSPEPELKLELKPEPRPKQHEYAPVTLQVPQTEDVGEEQKQKQKQKQNGDNDDEKKQSEAQLLDDTKEEPPLSSSSRLNWENKDDFVFKSEQVESGYYRIREKLKEIEMLEERRRCGFFLFPTQFKKVAKKKEYLDTIEEIRNGTWIPPITVKKPRNEGNLENDTLLNCNDEDQDGDDEEEEDIDNGVLAISNKDNEIAYGIGIGIGIGIDDDIINEDDPFGDLDDCLFDLGYQVVGTGLNGNVAPPTLNAQNVCINAQLQMTNTDLRTMSKKNSNSSSNCNSSLNSSPNPISKEVNNDNGINDENGINKCNENLNLEKLSD